MSVLEKFSDCSLAMELFDANTKVGIAVTLPDGRRHAIHCAPELSFNDAFEALLEWREDYEARKSAD